MKTINLLVYVVVVAFLAACAAETTAPKELRTTVQSIAGTEWVLTAYQNTPLPDELRSRTTIKISEASADGVFDISGRAFINGYFGKFRIDQANGRITPIDGIGATKVGGSQQDMAAESFYFQNLGNTTSFGINENDQLVLYFGDTEIGYFNKK